MTSADARTLLRLAHTDDIPEREGRSIVVDGDEIALFRCDGGIRAIVNACPHAGGPLADGLVAGDSVTCPLHGRRVDLLSGEVGDWETPVRVYTVTVEDGVIYLVR